MLLSTKICSRRFSSGRRKKDRKSGARLMAREDRDEWVLSNATTVSVEEAPALTARFGGVCYPAHIDRQANGIIATLGFLPPDMHFPTVELHDGEKEAEYRRQHIGDTTRVVLGSDAHVLWDIAEKTAWLDIPDEPYSSALVRANLIEMLKRGL
jgi:hypothetical protein